MTNSRWQDKPVTVLGLSKSGAAVARYIQHRGGRCLVSETLPATPTNEVLRNELQSLGVEIEMGGHTKQCFTHAPLVVTSPGIPPTSSVIEQLKLTQCEIISEVELAYREAQALPKPVPIIGITGTNGKSTTTSLVSAILTAAGWNAPACGNIGLPLLSVLDMQTPDYLVAELSSFQLAFSPTLTAQIAIFTNFTPDHLDWHGSLDAYLDAKLRLFTGKQSPQWSVVNADDPATKLITERTTGKVLYVSRHADHVAPYPNACTLDDKLNIVLRTEGKPPQTLLNARDLKILGAHNQENTMFSAATAFLLGIDAAVIQSACLAFESLPHRLEYVTDIDGVKFYNDSKATNPDAAIPALRSFDPKNPVVLIAGGYDKLTPLDEFAAEVKQHAGSVILIGKAKDRFNDELRKHGYTSIHFATTLAEAVRHSLQLAQESHARMPVVFSPACASFDMFKNFEERGDIFRQLVHDLKRESSNPPNSKDPAPSHDIHHV